MSRSGSDTNEKSALPSGDLRDDIVLPFQTVASGINGRVVRLGSCVDEILKKHDYPEPVSEVLGQAVAMTALLGAALKFDGKLILQTSTDGPLNFLVVNYETPGQIRGYARFDRELLEKRLQSAEAGHAQDILGAGHLAMTIDPDGDMERYQGIVAIEGQGLSHAALAYFQQSEQLPTFMRLAVARHLDASQGSGKNDWTWRAGGLFLQHLTDEGGHAVDAPAGDDPNAPESDPGDEDDALSLLGDDDDDWQRVRILAETVEDHELLDPNLSPQQLVYRLFHEEGVRVSPERDVEAHCQCSPTRVGGFLKSFGEDELKKMQKDDGKLSVTCEFCGEVYNFKLEELLSTKT